MYKQDRRGCEFAAPGWGLQEDFAVVLDLFAVFANLFHHGGLVRSLRELDLHFQRHEADRAVRDAFGLFGGLLHEVGAVGAVDFDFVGFFHLLFLLVRFWGSAMPFCVILGALD